MNPVKFNWSPEFLENTPFSCVVSPPLGKPDPYSFRIEKQVRLRIFQKAQEGPTCIFYAAKRISPRIGKLNFSHPLRGYEKAVSLFRKEMTSTMPLISAPIAEEQKTFMISRHLSYAGLKIHFPLQVWMSEQFYTLCGRPQLQDPLHLPKPFFDMVQRMQKIYTGLSIRLMLQKMCVLPLLWIPMMGPMFLVHALRTHLYLMCMGHFGKNFFTHLVPVGFHPKIGPVFSGPLKPIEPSPRSFFSMHAILVIGIRLRSVSDGDVYFIDPVDPSGPGLFQTVYKIHIADFFMRLRDSCGMGPILTANCEFVWVGIPTLFLA